MITIRLVNYNKLLKDKKLIKAVLLKNTYGTSTQPAVQNTQEDYNKQLKDFETLSNVTRKPRLKKPQKPPFAKNIFLGIFDTDILTYPQLEKDLITDLEQTVTTVEKLLKQSHMVNCNTLSNKHFRQNLADYKGIGLQAPQLMDGREYSVSESMRFLEALADHKLGDNIIYNEQMGVQTLVKYADDNLKKKYLYSLMQGESLSAFCMAEASFSDINSIKTKAKLSDDKKTWIINGEKTWVVNAVSADILIVFAVTEVLSKRLENLTQVKDTKVTAFVVERDFPGISCDKLDTDIEVANIRFNDTLVPSENVIGEVHKGEEILTSILSDFRLSSALPCISLTKKILNGLIKTVLEQSNDDNLLHKTDAIRGKFGEIIMSLYAMESMLYLTTGIMDSYEKQDCELENILVKIFSSQSCLNASMISLDLCGTSAACESHWARSLHNESLRYTTLHEANDGLKMIVALLGVQHAGVKLNDYVSKIRNPLYHGLFMWKRMWKHHKDAEDKPKLDLALGDYLHPSAIVSSRQLEYCVKRLQFATETLLTRYGPEVVNKHMELRRLADCIIDVYAMTACLGRASRSYCIGLQHSYEEMCVAMSFCLTAMERVKHNVQAIYMGQFHTNDESYRVISKNAVKSKGYFVKHPLARNF